MQRMASRGAWPLLGIAFLALMASAVGSRTLIDRRALAQSGATAVIIDEIHWDNIGLDYAEAVEILGPNGLNIGGYKLTRYAGSSTTSGTFCNTRDCRVSGYDYTFPDNTLLNGPVGAASGTAVVVFPAEGLDNNGAQIALSDASNQVLDYLVYASAGGTLYDTAAKEGVAFSLTPDRVTAAETGSTTYGTSVQRLGKTSWAASPSAHTFGDTYRQYYTTANSGGVATCRLLSDGSIVYAANTVSSCANQQYIATYFAPAIEPPLFAEGPRYIGAGVLPPPTILAGLRAGTDYRGDLPTPRPTTPAPTTPAPTTPPPTTPPPTTPPPTTPPPTTPPPTPTPTPTPERPGKAKAKGRGKD